MNSLTHGGDTYTLRIEKGLDVLDFSANISPLGLPPGVIKAVRQGLRQCTVYPDPLCRDLRAALADHHRLDPAGIVCGNGAADLIYRIVTALRPRQGLITAPSFSEYQKALREGGAEVVAYPLGAPHFQLDRSCIPHIHAKMDMLFLCNPNNPTGMVTEPELLKEIAEHCEKTGVLLVVDECFNEFLDEPEAHSLIDLLGSMKRLIILKAFTKFYAMPGFRLGYCLCGSPEIARAITAAGQAWPVSGIAQMGGIAALQERDYREKLRRLIQKERKKMRAALSALGLEVLGGEANYLFFRLTPSSGFDPDTFFPAMLDQGILLRNCANFSGLDNRYYRVAIRTSGENRVLLGALHTVKAQSR